MTHGGISDAVRRMPFLAGDLIRWPAAIYPDRIAIASDERISYAQLDREVDELAAAFAEDGARSGEAWGLALGNTPDFIRCLFALLRLGVAVAPLAKTRSADALARAGEENALDAVIVPPCDANVRPALLERGLKPHSVRNVDVIRLRAARPAGKARRLIDLDPALILRTSGSSGHARAVTFPHHALLANIWSNISAVGWRDDDVTLAILPLHHAYALVHQVLCHLAIGATVVLPQEAILPPRLCHEIESRGITTIATVPPIARFLAEGVAASGVRLPRLRIITVGAARAPFEALETLRDTLPHVRVAVTYGLTEAGPRVTTHFVDERTSGSDCVGRPLPNVDVFIAGSADGGPGEIAVRSRSAQCPDGLLLTGDLGEMRDGELYLAGRMDRTINRGGVKVAAEMIERTLREHPAVSSVVAAPMDDPCWGQVPIAIVATHGHATERELMSFCRSRLTPEECPVRISVGNTALSPKELGMLRQFTGFEP